MTEKQKELLREFEKAKSALDRLSLAYTLISPDPAYSQVGAPALVLDQETRALLYGNEPNTFVCSGWVDYQPARITVPQTLPKLYREDLLGTCAIMLIASCVVDLKRIRLIAHIDGDLTPVFPYLNSEMPHAMYNKAGPIFTFMEGYRIISLYPHRLTVAKADEIIDAWRTLEKLRVLINEVWMRRETISPSFEMRRKPSAMEVYKRLPGINCGACGEKTCMAFALRLWSGEAVPSSCKPLFEGEYEHLEAPFLTVCVGLGITDNADTEDDEP